MAYSIEITDAALREAEEYFHFILEQSNDSIAAVKWRDGLFDAVASLRTLPNRCPLIPEKKDVSEEARHLIYASHRIVFRIEQQRVVVLRVYHTDRRPLENS